VTVPSVGGLLPRAQALAAVAAEAAADADRERRLCAEVVDGIRSAGFARHFVPAELGGAEGSFAELTDAVVAVGEGCASAAWCASLTAFSARFAAHLPRAAYAELWGGSADTLIATALPPMGKATEQAGGGHRVSGRWAYVSGVDVAEWALVCAAVAGATGEGPELRFFALPRADYTVVETWDSIGMRATSTHTVVVENVLVPAHRSFARADMVSGDNRSSDLATHNVPFQAVGGLTFIAPAVGAGLGALRACAATLGAKRRSTGSDLDLVRASGRIDAARLLVAQNALALDTRLFTAAAMARNERNAAFAADQLATAVAELQRAAGTGGLSETGALQRFWRDITGAASHVALRYETAAIRTYPAALDTILAVGGDLDADLDAAA
jgi:alkylation response protein AidB-like acyl-CoA dehydrogenase